jgi:hypothetical protein
MLSDLYLIETFYGPSEMGLFFEDLARMHGLYALARALMAGDIMLHIPCHAQNAGRALVLLTPHGRTKIQDT